MEENTKEQMDGSSFDDVSDSQEDTEEVQPKKKRKFGKKFWIILLVIAVAAGSVYYFFGRKADVKDDAATAYVRTVVLSKGSLQNTVTASGSVSSQNTSNVTTTLKYTVKSVDVAVGDTVEAGDTIVTLDTEELEKQIARKEESDADSLEQLQQNVQDAQWAKDDAWSDYAEACNISNGSSYDPDYSAECTQKYRNFNSVNAKLIEAQENLAEGVTDYDLDDLKTNLANCTLKAETSGTVTAINATVGSAASDTVAVISDISSLQVEISVDEYDIQSIEKDMTAIITSDAVDKTYAGTVKTVSPVATTAGSGSGTSAGFAVTVTIDDADDSLLIGMNVKVQIVTSSEDDVYTVPIDAVGKDDSGNSVIYVQNSTGEFDAVEVTVGESNDYYTSITGDSLQEGLVVRASADAAAAAVATSDTEATATSDAAMGITGGSGMEPAQQGGGSGEAPQGGGPGGN